MPATLIVLPPFFFFFFSRHSLIYRSIDRFCLSALISRRFVHFILLSIKCLDSPTLHFTLCASNARVGLTPSPCSVSRSWCSAVGDVSTILVMFSPTAHELAQLMRCVQRVFLTIFDSILLPHSRCLDCGTYIDEGMWGHSGECCR